MLWQICSAPNTKGEGGKEGGQRGTHFVRLQSCEERRDTIHHSSRSSWKIISYRRKKKKDGILVQVTSPHNRGPLHRKEWRRDCSHPLPPSFAPSVRSFIPSFFLSLPPSRATTSSSGLSPASSFSTSAVGFPAPLPQPRALYLPQCGLCYKQHAGHGFNMRDVNGSS